MQKKTIFAILLTSGVLGFGVSYFIHEQNDLHLDSSSAKVETIETFHYPTLFVKQLIGDPDAGRKIFKEYCTSCHGNPPIIDISAPRIGDEHAWKTRRKAGINALLRVTTQGAGAMPARGGCFECSDEQLQETIRYILQH